MKFSYTPQLLDDYSEVEFTPRLWVTLKNPKTDSQVAVFGLVDSGAAEILIHSQIGEALGIDVASGQRALFAGIGGVIEGYRHKIQLQARGDKKVYEVECAFAPIEDIECLLGQRGFFENYKVVFEKYHNQFEIIARRRKRSDD